MRSAHSSSRGSQEFPSKASFLNPGMVSQFCAFTLTRPKLCGSKFRENVNTTSKLRKQHDEPFHDFWDQSLSGSSGTLSSLMK